MKINVGKFLAAALVLMGGCETWRGKTEAGVRYVDEFDLSAASCGMGKRVRARRSVDGNPLTLNGKAHARGFGTRPESAVAFRANGKVKAFDALVGIDDDTKAANRYQRPAAAIFKVWADGRVVWQSGNVQEGAKPVPVHVVLAGAREIVLETVGAARWFAFEAMNADWIDARFTCDAGAELEVVDDPAAFAQLGVLTPPEKPEPRINGADIWGVRPGRPVIFRVATSGKRPMTFSARNLPAGVTLDTAKGVLGGVAPTESGDYDIEVTAENSHGRATRTIRLAVGETIALTPPMGWNSWNTCCYRLTQEKAMAAARAMDESGLGDHGWAYVNLDDWWQMNTSGCARVAIRERELGREDVIGAARDGDGKILPNRSFPDMKALTDYIHSFGFKAGLYSSPGPRTCGECEGSYGHELQDAERYADWGFDYLKYDWCSYNDVFKRETGLPGGWCAAIPPDERVPAATEAGHLLLLLPVRHGTGRGVVPGERGERLAHVRRHEGPVALDGEGAGFLPRRGVLEIRGSRLLGGSRHDDRRRAVLVRLRPPVLPHAERAVHARLALGDGLLAAADRLRPHEA